MSPVWKRFVGGMRGSLAVRPGTLVHAVVGNQASDVDSILSAFVLAYVFSRPTCVCLVRCIAARPASGVRHVTPTCRSILGHSGGELSPVCCCAGILCLKLPIRCHCARRSKPHTHSIPSTCLCLSSTCLPTPRPREAARHCSCELMPCTCSRASTWSWTRLSTL